jgi:hypothetical protein
MNMTQHHGESNILKEASAAGASAQQWMEGVSQQFMKGMQQIGKISQVLAVLFASRRPISSMQVTWAGVLRSDSDRLISDPSEEVRFQVANEMFLCEEGKRLVFDDTWNQEAWSDTNGYRVVFKADSARRPKPRAGRMQQALAILRRN